MLFKKTVMCRLQIGKITGIICKVLVDDVNISNLLSR